MNTNKCKECQFFWRLEKGKRKGGTIQLTRGHCLKRSVFPKNKPGNPVYPPGAIVEDLPHHQGKPHIVHEDDVVASCTLFKVKA